MARSHSIASIAGIVAPHAVTAALALATALVLATVLLLAIVLAPTGALAPIVPAAAGAAVEAPTDLTVVRFKPDVVLRWNHPGRGISGFEIERATGPGDFARVGSVGREARTFRDREARRGVAYTYRVRAVAAGTVSRYSKETIVTVNASARR